LRLFYFFCVLIWRSYNYINGGLKKSNKEETRAFIRKNYAAVAQNGAAGGCCSSGCSCSGDFSVDINETTMNIGYEAGELVNALLESDMGLGCGNPIAIAQLGTNY